MADIFKEENIEAIKRKVGWAYSDMRWLTSKGVERANQERSELLNSLSDKAKHSFKQNKLHIGNLSPGCLICGQGTWSCMFINGLCTANCFYCAQNRNMKEERLPQIAEGITLDNPSDYILYLEKFNIKGVGFSGGEPMLVFPKLLEFTEKIRERFGKGFYLWAYTNGDLVDKDKLNRLKKAGLDEIRFDISARDYDLQPVEQAVGIIDTVTVEIPVIPEDFEKACQSLSAMQKLGVKHLNIHQLFATNFNYKNFIKRGYIFLHNSINVAVLESEITALKLMNFALKQGLGLPINYCSVLYKARLQSRGEMLRRAPFVKESFEEITTIGYIRQLSLQDTPANINKFVKLLEEKRCPKNSWLANEDKTEIFIPGSLLKHITFGKAKLNIRYFRPQFKVCTCSVCARQAYKEINLNPQRKIEIRKDAVTQKKLTSSAAIRAFQKIFIEDKRDKELTLGVLLEDYKVKTKEDSMNTKEEIDTLLSLKNWEYLASGWPEIY